MAKSEWQLLQRNNIYPLSQKFMKASSISVVGAIIQKEENGKLYVLVQTRWKPGTPYHDSLETPVGRLEERENIYHGLQREIQEETDLTITHINTQSHIATDHAQGFTPRYCTQQQVNNDSLPRIMLGFVCTCTGTCRQQEEETRNPRRISLEELETALANDKIFELQRPFFMYYLKHHKELTFQRFTYGE